MPGTQAGVFRSDDRGAHWEATDSPQGDVWSLAAHPQNPDIMYAGYDQCIICRSEDGGATWKKGNTKNINFPHITMNPYPICKRVIGLALDAHSPQDIYGAIEVGGLVASRDGGDNWESVTDGHYTRTGAGRFARCAGQFHRAGAGLHHHPVGDVPQPQPGQ